MKILQIFMLVVTFLVTASIHAIESEDFMFKMQEAINQFRSANYLKPLKYSPELSLLADKYKYICISSNSIEHNLAPVGWHAMNLSEISKHLKFEYVLELLQRGGPKSISASMIIWKFQQSSTHRDALLIDEIDYFGYSISRFSNGYYFVLYLGDGLYE